MSTDKLFDIEMQLKKIAFELNLPRDIVKEGIELSKEYIKKHPMVQVNTLVSAVIILLSKRTTYLVSQRLVCEKNNASLSSVKQVEKRLEEMKKAAYQ